MKRLRWPFSDTGVSALGGLGLSFCGFSLRSFGLGGGCSLGLCSLLGGLFHSSFSIGSLLGLPNSFCRSNALFEKPAAFEQGAHHIGRLGALTQTLTNGLGVETRFLRPRVVEAQLLQGTTVPT